MPRTMTCLALSFAGMGWASHLATFAAAALLSAGVAAQPAMKTLCYTCSAGAPPGSRPATTLAGGSFQRS